MKTFLEFYDEILAEAGVRMRQGRTKPPVKSTSTRKTPTKAQQSIQQAGQTTTSNVKPVALPKAPKSAFSTSKSTTSNKPITLSGTNTLSLSTQGGVQKTPKPKVFNTPQRSGEAGQLGNRKDLKIDELTKKGVEDVKNAIEAHLNALIKDIGEGKEYATKEYLIWSYILLPQDTVF